VGTGLHVGNLELDGLKVADRRPKACRCRAYKSDFVDAALRQPVASAGDRDPALVEDRQELGEPRPRSPSRFARRTRTSSKDSSCVSEAHQPTFEYPVGRSTPASDGTRIVESSSAAVLVTVTAATVMRAVMSVPELVMNALLPLMTHSSVARRGRPGCGPAGVGAEARLGQPEGGQGLPGSERGSHVRFCSSVPYR
jgi:hypothetical protein